MFFMFPLNHPFGFGCLVMRVKTVKCVRVKPKELVTSEGRARAARHPLVHPLSLLYDL